MSVICSNKKYNLSSLTTEMDRLGRKRSNVTHTFRASGNLQLLENEAASNVRRITNDKKKKIKKNINFKRRLQCSS